MGSDARLGDSRHGEFLLAWKDEPTPPRYPKEFRDDVVKIALDRGPEVTLAQIAKNFGIQVGTLDRRLHEERVEQGQKPDATRYENAELRELRKRNKLLE